MIHMKEVWRQSHTVRTNKYLPVVVFVYSNGTYYYSLLLALEVDYSTE